MSLRKNHLAKNDFPCHRRIKGDSKKIASRILRRRLNRTIKNEN